MCLGTVVPQEYVFERLLSSGCVTVQSDRYGTNISEEPAASSLRVRKGPSSQKWGGGGRQALYVSGTYLPKYAAPSHDISAFLARFILAVCVELFVMVNFPDSPPECDNTAHDTEHNSSHCTIKP